MNLPRRSFLQLTAGGVFTAGARPAGALPTGSLSAVSFPMLRSCSLRKSFAVILVALGVLGLAAGHAQADSLVDESIRARMLAHKDGRVAHIESEYHDVFVEKRGPLLALTTRARNETYFHSIVDLRDPDALPVPYTRIMNAAL